MSFRVVLLKARHFECLRDAAKMLQGALVEAAEGHRVALEELPPDEYRLRHGVHDVLLGAHAAMHIWDRLPTRFEVERPGQDGARVPIVYQTENLLRMTSLPAAWRQQCLRADVWDYSCTNAKIMRLVPAPLGYVPAFVRPLAFAPHPDVDVLFFGSVNERRLVALERMRALGLRVEQAIGLSGEDLDSLIVRSKVILNVHSHEPDLFESSHVLPLVHRGVCVLGEESLNREGAEFCTTVPYTELPHTALRLVQNDNYIVQRAEDYRRLRHSPRTSTLLRELLQRSQRLGVKPASKPSALAV